MRSEFAGWEHNLKDSEDRGKLPTDKMIKM